MAFEKGSQHTSRRNEPNRTVPGLGDFIQEQSHEPGADLRPVAAGWTADQNAPFEHGAAPMEGALGATTPSGRALTADPEPTAQRRALMARVRQKNTTPELKVRRFLHAQGLRFRLHDRSLPGSPDLVLPSRRVAVFVHGCFWHRHGCKATTTPKTRIDFWTEKFRANEARDRRNEEALLASGWSPITVWECDIKADRFQEALLTALKAAPIVGRRRVRSLRSATREAT